MKARWQELQEKSVAAMLSAIEIYNKPDFKYREETFAILAINAWELMLKAFWLKEHKNKIRSLYVQEGRTKSDGTPHKHKKIKLTSSGNPFTHGLDYLAKKLVEAKRLPAVAKANIDALCEIRDSSVHFYNKSGVFSVRLQEVGSACVRNYARLSQAWFSVNLSVYNFYLMPLAFISPAKPSDIVPLVREEAKVAEYISALEIETPSDENYAISVNVELRFLKSKAEDALKVQFSSDPNAKKLLLTEEQMKDRFPLTHGALVKESRERYLDFKSNQKFHDIVRPLKLEKKYCYVRILDPDNAKSAKQEWYSRAILNILDQHYQRK